jgi:hypothetical protein
MSNAGDRIRHGQASKPAEPFRRPTGRVTYPHRMSLDLDANQYRWLRVEAHESRVSAAFLIRAVLDELEAHGSVDLQQVRTVAERATTESLPPN